MARKSLPPITEAQWQATVDSYELGHTSVRQIARDLFVSSATVSRQMKRLGAVKGSRVGESIQDLEAALDRKWRRAALMEHADSKCRRMLAEANMKAIGQMIEALLEADQRSDLSLASPVIDRVGQAVDVRRRRRTRA